MLKKTVFFIVFLLFGILYVNSAQVNIETQIYKESTLFEYSFQFNENESYKSFSFEKPKDAKMIYALENGVNIEYSAAGDYFIIKPEDTSNKNFTIKFISILKSQEIIEGNIFSIYTNFNFPIDNLIFKVLIKDNFGEILEIVPRNYEINTKGSYIWELDKVSSDTFFLIKFENKSTKINPVLLFFDKYWHIGFLILVLFIFIGSAVIFKRKGYVKKINLDKFKVNPFQKKEQNINNIKQEVVNEEKFEELTSKYLTDNEKEVVEIVKNNQGISQYDILNYIPSITKSNLSKIISKLHSRKILNRIKVGKINKIYLGSGIEKGSIEEKQEENK